MPTPISIKNLVLSQIVAYAIQKLQKEKKGSPENIMAVRDLFNEYKGEKVLTEQEWLLYKQRVAQELKRLGIAELHDHEPRNIIARWLAPEGRIREIMALLDAIQLGELADLNALKSKLERLKETAHYGAHGKKGMTFFEGFDSLFAEPAAATAPQTATVMAPADRIVELERAFASIADVSKSINKTIAKLTEKKAEIIASENKTHDAYVATEKAHGFAYDVARNHLIALRNAFRQALYDKGIRHAIDKADLLPARMNEGEVLSALQDAETKEKNIDSLATGTFQLSKGFKIASRAATEAKDKLAGLNTALCTQADKLREGLALLITKIEQLQTPIKRGFKPDFIRDTLAEFQSTLNQVQIEKARFAEIANQIASQISVLFDAYANATRDELQKSYISPEECRQAIEKMLKAIYQIKESETFRDSLRENKAAFSEPLRTATDTPGVHAGLIKGAKSFYDTTRKGYPILTAAGNAYLTQDISKLKTTQAELLGEIEKIITGLNSLTSIAVREHPALDPSHVIMPAASASAASGGAASGGAAGGSASGASAPRGGRPLPGMQGGSAGAAGLRRVSAETGAPTFR